jgi:hypothetical protein
MYRGNIKMEINFKNLIVLLESISYGGSCEVSNDECDILLDLKCENSTCVCSNITYYDDNMCGMYFFLNFGVFN